MSTSGLDTIATPIREGALCFLRIADSERLSWEPARNLAQCGRLVESFWDDVGIDDEDYPEGTVCEPSTKWIG